MKKCIPIFIMFMLIMNYMMISIICNYGDIYSSIALVFWSMLIFILAFYSGKVLYQDTTK